MEEKVIKASKMILKGIFLGGAIAIAATSPNFVQKALPKILKQASFEWKKYKNKKKFLNSFNYLRSSGLINMEYRGNQLYVSLTEEGKKKVKKYWIDDLKITKPEKWDGKWRIMIFDVKDKQKIKREGLRGKIKELGLYQLQKSVWVCPYNFDKEAGILRDFFGFDYEEMKLIVASEIEGDGAIRQYFKL